LTRDKAESSAFLLFEEMIKELESFYFLENRQDVEIFLGFNLFLMEILMDAPCQIVRIFGESVKLYLQLFIDPEEDFEEIFIVIKNSFSPDEAIKRLNKLDDEWFLGIMDKTQGKLNITEGSL